MLFSVLLTVASLSAVAVAESYSIKRDCSTSSGSFQGQNYKCDVSGDESVFYQCDHGEWIPMRCAAGTFCDVDQWLHYRQSPCVAGRHDGYDYASQPTGYIPKSPSYTPSYAPKRPSYTPVSTPSYTPNKPSYVAKPTYTPSYAPKPAYTPSQGGHSHGGESSCNTGAGSWNGQNYKCNTSGDSSVFYQCDQGEWVEMRCAEGTECNVQQWFRYHESPCVAPILIRVMVIAIAGYILIRKYGAQRGQNDTLNGGLLAFTGPKPSPHGVLVHAGPQVTPALSDGRRYRADEKD
ncbi:hypothetical protein HK101_002236 [Irineochytrium annulatum]|nr:hypothetical protein HK101_002236 [Irineochytrium annulatum]